jgi:hypothetical protein
MCASICRAIKTSNTLDKQAENFTGTATFGNGSTTEAPYLTGNSEQVKMWLKTWVNVPNKTGKSDLMKLKGISSTPAAFDLIDITALKTSSSVIETKENSGTLVETRTSKSIPVLNDGLVKKKTTEPLHINVVVKHLGDDAKSTQIIVQFPQW